MENRQNSSHITTIVVISVLLTIIIVIIVALMLNNNKNKAVLKSSQYISRIISINGKYSFKSLSKEASVCKFYLSSKRAFDNFNCLKKRDLYIKENIEYFIRVISVIDFNENQNYDYSKELSSIEFTSDVSLAKENNMSLKSYRKREIKLGRKLIKHPQLNYRIIIKWEYTSPAGRNHYSNTKTFSLGNIKETVNTILSSHKAPFLRQSLHEAVSRDDIEDIEE